MSRYVYIEWEQNRRPITAVDYTFPGAENFLSLGEECAVKRRRLELTVKETAELMGVSRFSIIKMEADKIDNTSLLEFLNEKLSRHSN